MTPVDLKRHKGWVKRCCGGQALGGPCYGCSSGPSICLDCNNCATCGGPRVFDRHLLGDPKERSNPLRSPKFCPRCWIQYHVQSSLYQNWCGQVVCEHCWYVSWAIGSIVSGEEAFIVLSPEPWDHNVLWPLYKPLSDWASDHPNRGLLINEAAERIAKFREDYPGYFSANVDSAKMAEKVVK